MQRFLKWLAKKIFPDKEAPNHALRRSGDRRVPQAKAKPRPRPAAAQQQPESESVDFSTELGGKIEDGGPGKNVLVRNKYVREDSGTHETLTIIDDSIVDGDDDGGLDPYNTGRFDRSKTWDSSRSRK